MPIHWFLPMILFLGIVASYEDIMYGKIRNRWIVVALTYSFVVNLFLISIGKKYKYPVYGVHCDGK